MLGTEGIAVGMSARILPHNFPELLQAQIAILKKQPFKVLPDFQTGGLMDAREYRDGAGQIKVRAKIKIKDDSTVVIKEIPPNDHHRIADRLHRRRLAQGQDQGQEHQRFHGGRSRNRSQARRAASAPNNWSTRSTPSPIAKSTIASRIVVIKDNRPVEMTVSEVLARKHRATCRHPQARTGIEAKASWSRNCISKRSCGSSSKIAFTRQSSRPHQRSRRRRRCRRASSRSAARCCRDLAAEDIEMLLGIRIRRISLFDINKHREEMDKVKADLEQTREYLKNVTKYAIAHLEALLEKYGPLYPRLTKSSRYDEVDAREVGLQGLQGRPTTASPATSATRFPARNSNATARKFDKLLMVFKDGHYKVVELPEKMFVGPDLVYCGAAGTGPGDDAGLHQPRGDLSEAVHLWRDDSEQGIFLHSAQVENPVL